MKQVVRNRNDALRFIDRVCLDLGQTFDAPYLMSFALYRPPRSHPQNAKCHAMIRELAQAIGYSDTELKEWFKLEFGPKKRLTINGVDKVIPLSTLDYNRSQMSEFIGQIERVAAEIDFRFREDYELD